jgi:hypothetical protein
MGIGDWGLGIGDWGLGPIPNPQSPIPNPQSPIPMKFVIYLFNVYIKLSNLFFNFLIKFIYSIIFKIIQFTPQSQ